MLGAQANIWPLLEAQLQLLSTNTALLPKHTNSLKQLTEAHDKLSCQSQKPRDHNAGSGSASCDGDMVMAVITILFMKSMVEVTLVTVVLNNVLLAQQMLRLPKGSYHCCRLLHLRFFFFGWVTGELSTLRHMMKVPNEPCLSPNNGLENAFRSDQSMASTPRKGQQAKNFGAKTTRHDGKAGHIMTHVCHRGRREQRQVCQRRCRKHAPLYLAQRLDRLNCRAKQSQVSTSS